MTVRWLICLAVALLCVGTLASVGCGYDPGPPVAQNLELTVGVLPPDDRTTATTSSLHERIQQEQATTSTQSTTTTLAPGMEV